MNGLNRTSLLAGLVVALLALFSSVVLAEESTGDATAIEEAASFDQKYLLPDYIAYSGAESIAEQALAMRTAASFDAKYIAAGNANRTAATINAAAAFDVNFLTPGTIVHIPSANQNLEDFDNKSLTAESIVIQSARPDYVAHGVDGVALISLEGSELEDFDDKYLVAGNDTTWVMQQAMAVPDLEDFENKSLDTEIIVSQTARPNYVAHGVDGIAAVNSEASNLEDFENKSLTTGNDSLVDATEIQVAHWQTMTEFMNQYGMFTIDPDALAAAPAGR